MPPGSDPADLLTQHGPTALLDALAATAPLGEHLLEERLANLPSHRALPEAAEVLAARPPHVWADGLHRIAEALAVSTTHSQQALLTAAQGFTHDAARVSADQLARTSEVRQRLAAIDGPAQRWADLARRLDPRLVHALDWPATAAMLQQAHEHGHNVDRLASTLVAQGPLDDQPGQDLRYRLATQLPPDDPPGAGGHCPQPRWTADKYRLSVPIRGDTRAIRNWAGPLSTRADATGRRPRVGPVGRPFDRPMPHPRSASRAFEWHRARLTDPGQFVVPRLAGVGGGSRLDPDSERRVTSPTVGQVKSAPNAAPFDRRSRTVRSGDCWRLDVAGTRCGCSAHRRRAEGEL